MNRADRIAAAAAFHPFSAGGGHEDFGYALAPLCRVCKQTFTQGPHARPVDEETRTP